jgi:phosphoribosylanthranilate isomerase
MSVRIKLCGIKTPQDALLCAEAGADEVGVILAPGSRRRITLSMARLIREQLPVRIAMTGVFQDALPEELEAALRAVPLDAVQLHGKLPTWHPAVKTIVALQVGRIEDLDVISTVGWADRILLDSPQGGGSGTAFDWSLARSARALGLRQLFIAGGLRPDNVADAIRAASGIEDPATGFKDPEKVRAFVQAARAAEAP